MLKNKIAIRFKGRAITLVLAALLIGTAFAACGTAPSDTSGETQAEETSVDETAALPSPEAIDVADAAASGAGISENADVTGAGVDSATTDGGVAGAVPTTASGVAADKDASKADAKKPKKEKAKSKTTPALKDTKSSEKTDEKADADSDKTPTPKPVDEKITVSVAVDCLTLYAADPDKAAMVSSNGIILAKKSVTVKKDASVYDVLKASGITFVGSAYVESINGLSERDGGSKSGWVYSVNGVFPGKGILKYTVKGNDAVAFRYTLDGGPDVK